MTGCVCFAHKGRVLVDLMRGRRCPTADLQHRQTSELHLSVTLKCWTTLSSLRTLDSVPIAVHSSPMTHRALKTHKIRLEDNNSVNGILFDKQLASFDTFVMYNFDNWQ